MPGIGTGMAPTMDRDEAAMSEGRDLYYPYPTPTPPGGYIANLETYETTDYTISVQTRDFDDACGTLRTLKTDDRFEFRQLQENLNSCTGQFFAKEEHVNSVLETFGQFNTVEVTRATESVTSYRSELESQADILRQQLESVDRTLKAAEIQYDEITEFARANKDAATLSVTIREKLQMVESLTQQKIQLTNSLAQTQKQAGELEQRLGLVQFNVTITRLSPIYLNETERAWEMAWKRFNDQMTTLSIALTAGLGTFVLVVGQYLIYLLILLLLARGLWKVALRIWKL